MSSPLDAITPPQTCRQCGKPVIPALAYWDFSTPTRSIGPACCQTHLLDLIDAARTPPPPADPHAQPIP